MKKTLLIVFVFASLFSKAQDYKSFPMWDYHLPMEKRVNDVVSRLTLEEKVAQMLDHAPAVPRLGIPAYDWWSEVLHGVARTPYKVTVYPQAIAMAATWDTNSLYRMAGFAADEGRAIFNKSIQDGREGERYVGLTYWTPNINIFRDPRWGRGQETYGEDPFLTAMLGKSFVHGLQGDDPKYLKAAACAKHFAVHSGPESTRHSDNFNPSLHDLWDTYLPAFRELVVNAKVAGVMCAYNAVNTQPCCANDLLMNDILRNQWKFTGYVTSDCWALNDFFDFHKTHKDALAAGVGALIHGTDVECGVSVYTTLVNAVRTGLIKEEQIDVSLKRLFDIRYRLGLFDPSSTVPYAQTPLSVLESPEHKAQALKMARQSIVLLKNENSVLPLSKKIKKIVVLGPNADNKISVLGNYNGTPSKIVTLLDGIKEKLGNSVEVIYEKAINYTNDTLLIYNDVSKYYTIDGKSGIKAAYFNNEKLEGAPLVTRTEDDIDRYWPEGQTPAPSINTVHYSGRYTTNLKARKDEIINYEIDGNVGYRISIEDSLYINNWTRDQQGAKQFQLNIKKDKQYKIVVEFWQGEGSASISLKSGHYEKTDFEKLADKYKDVDGIVFAGGISPQLEGEEMPVAVPGFKGGDRTSIMLPEVQTRFLKALKKTDKPIVFVMMTGSAVAIPWEDENIPAIVNGWYGGQSAGTAIADVLFGDYNPAGRLPVTFYKSDADIPAFNSYDMKGRTYRYFTGEALYPFGYGLSYTSFKYDQLKTPATIAAGKSVSVTVRVMNTGKKDGEEVVQLYVADENNNELAPIKALKGFKRIALKAGESKMISFVLSPADLSLINENGQAHEINGKAMISIGGGQPGVKNKATSNVVQQMISIR